MGDGIDERTHDRYVAFRQIKTFAYFHFNPNPNRIVLDVPLPHDSVDFEEGFTFTRPMAGKWVQVWIDSAEDVERAQVLIQQGYQQG